MGGKKHNYKVTLPSGREAKMHNGDRGFFKRAPCTLRIWEGIKCLPGFGIPLTDKLSIGKGTNSFPSDLNVSKHHLTAACLNNYYFLKDAGSKHGSYVKLAKGAAGKNGRVELHKGMTFSVGKLGLKVSDIQGAAHDNKEAIAQRDKARKENEAKAAASGGGKDAELDSDEEFAEDSDEGGGGGGSGKTTKLDGPPVMFLSSVDKKKGIKGRIRATSTIGSESETNKIAIEADLAKKCALEAVHTRIVLDEEGRFFLEDASKGSSGYGTYVGLPRKKFFEVNPGDKLLLGGCRCAIDSVYFPVLVRPLDGIIDHMMGADELSVYDMKVRAASPHRFPPPLLLLPHISLSPPRHVFLFVCFSVCALQIVGAASIEERLVAALEGSTASKSKPQDDD